ncbi:hypothetical protein SH1V18_11650 [Vallitalea longa]|uniref:SLH domain-containing protein n=1 Tax=Vallitalea longa TaxID=2936439 RepID=A0A9W5Y9T7_9FIRM|nr:S-layer homology domain-containing protein [Vallitalea longa]GKX28685.1 hypothetical protein SH1V18_11650 [Vallitalea longa]
MKPIKNIFLSLLVLVIITVNVDSINAKTMDSNEIQVLSQLNILKGNGVSLDLDSKLSRSEAAAFIVRLLCEEEEVKDNKIRYCRTKFSDVPEDMWYAPYVGYCTENDIIDGYDTHTFKPDEKLGEKAFIKLVLGALGYKYNKDFTWDEVFKKAYGIGLLEDNKYYSNEYKEDTNYTRGKVASILYTALELKNNKTKIKIIQNFIDNNYIEKDEAEDLKLINDEIKTEITKVETTGSNILKLTFNEKILPFTEENILIYETDNTANMLSIEDISNEETTNTYIIKTSDNQKMDEEYTVLLDRIVDTKGNASDSFSEIFMGHREDEVKSDFFRISKVEAISNNVIYLYFTHPINENALQSAFYSVSQNGNEIIEGTNNNMLISKLNTCNNGISIYLKSYTFESESYIQLDVDGRLSSLYGVKLNDGKGDKIKFKSSVENNEVFTVDNCTPINNHTVQVNFNKEVNPLIANQVFMYYVTDEDNNPIKITKAEVVNEGSRAGKAVRLTTNSSIIYKEKYKLLINNMSDVTMQFSITLKEFSFIGGYYNSDDIEIDAVVSLDNNTIAVYVSEPLDQKYTESVDNYIIEGVSDYSYLATPTAVYYDKKKNANMFKLYLPDDKKLTKSHRYDFTIISLKDTLGNTQSYDLTKQFKHTASKDIKLSIKEATYIGDNTIKLSFNKEVAFDINNILTTNYTLVYTENGMEYSKIPLGANYINPTTITLKFDTLDMEKEYKVVFKELIDYGNNVTENTEDKSCAVKNGNE